METRALNHSTSSIKKGPPPLVPDTPEEHKELGKKLKIYLRDVDKTVVEAWNVVFHDPRVENLAEAHDTKLEFDIAEGSTLDIGVEVDALISPCHGTGSMTSGVNNVYLQSFGARLELDMSGQIAKKHHGVLPVGRALVISLSRYTDKFRFLIGSPVAMLTGHVESLGPFLAFKSVLEIIETYNSSVKQDNKKITSIACSGLGINEGIPAFRCALQMRAAIDSYFGAAFVGRDFKAMREFYIFLTTIKKPFAIQTLYQP
jgi:hypothetical protein